ncbi:MAG: lipoprotein [Spiroplasma sp.]|nr:lipoprotein [Spiroplasma sp.]
MKKLLSILGAISLTALASTTVVACNKDDKKEEGKKEAPETFVDTKEDSGTFIG